MALGKNNPRSVPIFEFLIKKKTLSLPSDCHFRKVAVSDRQPGTTMEG